MDRFRLLERVGSGGHGHGLPGLRRAAAAPGRGEGDRRAPTPGRVAREAQAAARLNHPGIVTLYELGSDEDRALLVSELVEGATLAELAQCGDLSDREVAEFGADVCEALAHAHERGVIHRDVKPQNVIVRVDDGAGRRAKLMDFGIASLAGAPTLTATGEVVGTLAYMAPEQAEGMRRLRARRRLLARPDPVRVLDGHKPGGRATRRPRRRARSATRIPPLRDYRPDLPAASRRPHRRVPRRRSRSCDRRWTSSTITSTRRSPGSTRTRAVPAARTTGGASPARARGRCCGSPSSARCARGGSRDAARRRRRAARPRPGAGRAERAGDPRRVLAAVGRESRCSRPCSARLPSGAALSGASPGREARCASAPCSARSAGAGSCAEPPRSASARRRASWTIRPHDWTRSTGDAASALLAPLASPEALLGAADLRGRVDGSGTDPAGGPHRGGAARARCSGPPGSTARCAWSRDGGLAGVPVVAVAAAAIAVIMEFRLRGARPRARPAPVPAGRGPEAPHAMPGARAADRRWHPRCRFLRNRNALGFHARVQGQSRSLSLCMPTCGTRKRASASAFCETLSSGSRTSSRGCSAAPSRRRSSRSSSRASWRRRWMPTAPRRYRASTFPTSTRSGSRPRTTNGSRDTSARSSRSCPGTCSSTRAATTTRC